MKQTLIHLGLALLAVFAPAKSMILSSLALVLVDLITGVLAAKKQNIPITSSGLKRSIIKLLLQHPVVLDHCVGNMFRPSIRLIFNLAELTNDPESSVCNLIDGDVNDLRYIDILMSEFEQVSKIKLSHNTLLSIVSTLEDLATICLKQP